MIRNFSIVAALAATLLIAPSCKKDKEKSEAGGDKAATKVQDSKTGGDTKVTPEKGASKPAAAGDVMSMIPASSEIVVTLSLASLKSSAIWKDVSPALENAGDGALKEMKEVCGFDPMDKFKSMTFGVNTENSEEPVIVVAGVDRAEVTQCATKMAEKKGEKVDVKEDGAFTMVAGSSPDKNMTIAWKGDMMVVVPGKDNKDFLQARLDGKDSITGNAAFMAVAGKAKQSAPIWFGASFKEGSPALKQMSQMGQAPKGLYGSLGFNSGLQLDVGVGFADEAAAKQMLTMAQQGLPMAKGALGPAGAMIDKVKMATSGSDMTVNVNLNDKDLEMLKGMAGPMLGGM